MRIYHIQTTKAEYDNLKTKENNALYFLEDTYEIFKGTSRYSAPSNLKFVPTEPEFEEAEDGVLYVINGEGSIKFSIKGESSMKPAGGYYEPTVLVDDESEMLSLKDIEPGQQIYRNDTGTIWIYTGGDISDISNWIEPTSGSSWDGTKDRIVFKVISQSEFDRIAQKDSNTLYFITDSGAIYKGQYNVTGDIIIDSIPDISSAIKGKLYVDPISFSTMITTDGNSWIQTSPGYLTDGYEWAEADSRKFATIGLIKKGIEQTIESALANKITKVVGVEDNILTFAKDGEIKDSGKKFGGATLSQTPDSNTVATEAAVAAEAAKYELTWGSI